MPIVETKDGPIEVGGGNGSVPPEAFGASPRPNAVSGDVTIKDRFNRTFVLRPTFEACLEIEDQIGGIETLRMRAASPIHLPGLTTREVAVIFTAGVRASGEQQATVEKAVRAVWAIGRPSLMPGIRDYLYALHDGGRLRMEDLKNEASFDDSPQSTKESETAVSDLIGRLSENSSASR